MKHWAACHCGRADRGLQEDVEEKVISLSKGIDPVLNFREERRGHGKSGGKSWEQQVAF